MSKKGQLFFYLGSGLIFAFLAVLLFSNFTKVGYIPQDYNYFRDYIDIHNAYSSPLSGDRWAPILQVIDALEVRVFNLNPFYPRLIVMAFYLVNFILGLLFLNLITKKRLLSFLTILLFVIYGKTASLIFSTNGQQEVIIATLFLLCFIFYYMNLQNRKNYLYILSVICYPLVLTFKESAVVLPFILFCIEFFLNEHFEFKKAFKRLLPFLIIFLVYGLIIILTAVPNTKNQAPDSLLQRGEYFLQDIPHIINNFFYLLFGHLPLAPYSTHIPSRFIIYILGILFIFTVTLIFLKTPKYIKFFLSSVWILMLPYALFTSGYGERYVYFSGLFFISFLVFGLWVILKKNLLTKGVFVIILFFFALFNTKFLALKITQWEEVGQIMKNLNTEFLSKYPTLQSPLYIVDLPQKIGSDGEIHIGFPGNYIYFLYNKTWPGYLYIGDKIGAIEDYKKLKQCKEIENKPVHAIIYQNDGLQNWDIDKESIKITTPVDCAQNI